MIIVSQDKRALFPFNKSIFASVNHVYGDVEAPVLLGIYDTNERAKEVLADIVDHYHHRVDVYPMPKV